MIVYLSIMVWIHTDLLTSQVEGKFTCRHIKINWSPIQLIPHLSDFPINWSFIKLFIIFIIIIFKSGLYDHYHISTVHDRCPGYTADNFLRFLTSAHFRQRQLFKTLCLLSSWLSQFHPSGLKHQHTPWTMHKNILNATQQQKSATFKSNAGNKSNVSRCTIKTKTKATCKQTIQKYFPEPFEYWSWYYWILVNECDFLISREPSSLLKRSSPIIFQKGNFFKATQYSF